eukprot:1673935-Pleurochrysis_carterae.AAC.1
MGRRVARRTARGRGGGGRARAATGGRSRARCGAPPTPPPPVGWEGRGASTARHTGPGPLAGT